ncbi:porin [Acidithiobacillus sp.]|uniref:porin n=1 Tax=Acidithiobacillus sp. TaxID=1872118 RepID=UPI0025B847E8|nr:porin [Acidithiobacillus sp.]
MKVLHFTLVSMVVAGCSLPAFASANNADTGPVLFGLAQITAAQQFGTGGPEGLVFGGHRIRLGVYGNAVPGVNYFFQYKWDGLYNSATPGFPAGSSEGVSTALLNFRIVPQAQIQVGKFIVPVGLERYQFGERGNNLWFIQRSMNNDLFPNRDIGVMLHGDDLGVPGFSYALGIFNNASTTPANAYSAAHINAIEGLAPVSGGGQGGFLNGSGNYLFAGMLSYRFSPLFSIELSGDRANALGTVKHLGRFFIPEAASETTWNVGIRGGLSGVDYLAEYTRNQNFAGVAGDDVSDAYVALKANLRKLGVLPYDISPTFRFDHYEINSNPNWQYVQGWIGVSGQTLDNLTAGFNYDLNPNDPYAARIQVNYILPMGNAGVFRYNVSHPQNILAQSGAGFVPFGAAIYNTLEAQLQVGF